MTTETKRRGRPKRAAAPAAPAPQPEAPAAAEPQPAAPEPAQPEQNVSAPLPSQPAPAQQAEVTPDGLPSQPPQPKMPPAQPAAAPHITDPRQQQFHIAYTPTPSDKVFGDERNNKGWPHVRPFSCFVGAIGNHWKPGSWARTVDMVQHCNEQGMFVRLDEIQDRCSKPYDALGVMRNEVIMRAEAGGYEYVCMVDNDVLPAHDTLLRMLRRMFLNQVTALAPYVLEPGTSRPLHGPVCDQFVGIRPVRWNVLSMIVFKTSVFRGFPPGSFWDNPLGADEGYHYQKLYNMGHTPFIDTDVMLPVYQAPHYPLTIDKQANAEQMWASSEAERQAIPNRDPLDPRDPRRTPEGVYLPFLVVNCPKELGGCGQPKPGDWWKHGPVCAECAQRIATAGGTITLPEQPKADGYYTVCKAVDPNGAECKNWTPAAHGFCHVHTDRAPRTQ